MEAGIIARRTMRRRGMSVKEDNCKRRRRGRSGVMAWKTMKRKRRRR